MKKFLAIVALSLLFSSYSFADSLKVIDGDSIKINGERIRFGGIDAPETNYLGKKQPCYLNEVKIFCGNLSTEKLKKKIGNNRVSCEREKNKDRYGRTVAECFVNGESLSKFLVRSGYAFAYRKYSNKFIKDEEYARANKLGMWDMIFQYPWEFRKLQ